MIKVYVNTPLTSMMEERVPNVITNISRAIYNVLFRNLGDDGANYTKKNIDSHNNSF